MYIFSKNMPLVRSTEVSVPAYLQIREILAHNFSTYKQERKHLKIKNIIAIRLRRSTFVFLELFIFK